LCGSLHSRNILFARRCTNATARSRPCARFCRGTPQGGCRRRLCSAKAITSRSISITSLRRYCHRSAPQLFDLANDPDEWENLAGERAVAEIEDELQSVITGRFDLDFIERDVNERLAQKQVVNAAMASNGTSWDHRVDTDPARQYVRS
jgi:hypothetical protein